MTVNFLDHNFPHVIEHMVIPLFKGMLNNNGLYALYDKNGTLLMLSDAQVQMFAAENSSQCLGLNLGNLPIAMLEKIATKAGVSIQNVWLDFNQMFTLHQYVVEKQEIVQYIDLSPYYNNLSSHMVTIVPFFHPSGELIAYQTHTRQCSINILINLLKDYIGMDNSTEDSLSGKQSEFQEKFGIELSERQHEILFLMSNGLNQYKVADLLNISRSTVAKILNTQIIRKFNLNPPNTAKLIERAVSLGINELIPFRLRKQKFILFDSARAKQELTEFRI